MKDIEHLLRVAATFVVVICGFLLVRWLVVPPSFGRLGHYRAAAVSEIRALPARYAGAPSCAPCHKGQTKDKAAGPHRGMACESCHGPSAAHALQPRAARPLRPREAEARTFCGRCHGRSLSRPRGFPQVDLAAHNPEAACTSCHNPHRPK